MAAESSIVSGIAGRYAKALFELALEAGALDAVAGDLARIQEMVQQSSDLLRLIRSPVFTRGEQAGAIAAVLSRAGIGDLVRRFVGVLAANRRLFALLDVIRDYRLMLAEHRGEMAAEIRAAQPLDERQVAQLKAALRDAMKREVDVNVRVEPELLGGLVVKLGSRMFDASVRTKLNNMKIAMKGAG